MTQPIHPDEVTARLELLAIYRVRRRELHNDVRAALSSGATQTQVAEASGLTRQWVAKIRDEKGTA